MRFGGLLALIQLERTLGAICLLAAALLLPAPATALSAASLDEEAEAEAAVDAAEPPPAASPESEPPASEPPASDAWAPDPDLYADDPPEPPPEDPWAVEPDLYADEEDTDADDEDLYQLAIPEPDPFETANRGLLYFNNGVDRFLLDPASKAYQFVMPDFAERALLRAFANFNSPVTLVNDVFQLEFRRAGVTLSRLVVNSTVGLAGFIDVAERMGLEAHVSDFGMTLAKAGLGSGPYIVIPVLGPSTARDAVGFGVDLLFRPLFYLIGPFDFLFVGTGNGFLVRASYMEELEALREGSVDYYATLRNAYFQRRAEQLREIGVDVVARNEDQD
jgi:phospholipid-binding lipoprotein MlaA